MKTLQCHSRGNKDFSPLFAHVTAFDQKRSIEDHYQSMKRFLDTSSGEIIQAKSWREGKSLQKDKSMQKLGFFLPSGIDLGTDNSTIDSLPIQYYKLLWYKYYKLHPEFVDYAREFDEFEDIFKGSFPYCQADVIRDVVKYGVDYLKDNSREVLKLMSERK